MNKDKWIELKVGETILWRFPIEKEENLKALENFMKKLYYYEENKWAFKYVNELEDILRGEK